MDGPATAPLKEVQLRPPPHFGAAHIAGSLAAQCARVQQLCVRVLALRALERGHNERTTRYDNERAVGPTARRADGAQARRTTAQHTATTRRAATARSARRRTKGAVKVPVGPTGRGCRAARPFEVW